MPQSAPKAQDICHEARTLATRVERLEDALPRNELGKPDYEWLRIYSGEKKEAAHQMRQYQMAFATNAIRAVVSALLAAFGWGYFEPIKEVLATAIERMP